MEFKEYIEEMEFKEVSEEEYVQFLSNYFSCKPMHYLCTITQPVCFYCTDNNKTDGNVISKFYDDFLDGNKTKYFVKKQIKEM